MMEENNNNFEWLIRDNSNLIRGPYKHSEILNLIKKGQLKGKTEVSRANSYWFAIEEKAELARFFPELGLKAPEQPTQMTATLTQADVADHGVEITQFTSVSSRSDLAGEKPAGTEISSGTDQIQWLNDEFAEEFGEELSSSNLSMETRTVRADMAPAPEDGEKTEVMEPAPSEKTDAKANELLSRSTVKSDTLPSEHKSFSGDRPKPITDVMKGAEKSSSTNQHQANIVSMPVSVPEAKGNIYDSNTGSTDVSRIPAAKKVLFLVLGLVSVVAIMVVVVLSDPAPKVSSGQEKSRPKITGSYEDAVKKSLVLFHLEGAKEALSEFELEPSARGKITLPLAQALMKKEFLYDADGAFMSLQTARSLASGNKRIEAEVDNLISVYKFEKDQEGSISGLRAVIGEFPEEAVFRYNLALAQLRAGNHQEAIQIASSLTGSVSRTDPLAEDISFLLGWARDAVSKGKDPAAEAAYLKAIDSNRNSAKARLGLAIHRFRKNGIRESEGNFRAFLDLMPELDPPSRVLNFRKMSDFDFYGFARNQIRELNVPMGAAGIKPSPLVMAVDSILSCLQSRTGEAGKILESALRASPGDLSLLKALGYHRWKEARYPELIELLKDLPREKKEFSMVLLLGKAYEKTGRRDLAESHFESLIAIDPSRSEGWALLGDLQLQQGRADVAKRNFESALERDPYVLVAIRGMDRLGNSDPVSAIAGGSLPF